jgi:hypothetical protein
MLNDPELGMLKDEAGGWWFEKLSLPYIEVQLHDDDVPPVEALVLARPVQGLAAERPTKKRTKLRAISGNRRQVSGLVARLQRRPGRR